MKYLTLCCIAKDEHFFIKEWIEYHLLIGVDQIIIYDNESDPPLCVLLREYIDRGLVIVHTIRGQEQQIPAYNHCLKSHGSESKWIAFVDVDECILSKSCSDIRVLLTDYEEYGGLGVHWVEFGSSGHVKRPSRSQLGSFLHRFPFDYPKNLHIKSIIQPQKVLHAANPHSFVYKRPWYCVDENFFPLAESQGPFSADKIQLNHYYYRSQEDYCFKLIRGRADRVDEAGKRKHDAFYMQLGRANIYDDIALKYAKKISKIDSTGMYFDHLKNTQNKKDINYYIANVLKDIAFGNMNRAQKTIRIMKLNFPGNEELINFIQFRIYSKQGDLKKSLSFLVNNLTEKVDPDACIEYVRLQIKMGDYTSAHRMLKYMKWRFATIIKKDIKYAHSVDYFFKETSDRIEKDEI